MRGRKRSGYRHHSLHSGRRGWRKWRWPFRGLRLISMVDFGDIKACDCRTALFLQAYCLLYLLLYDRQCSITCAIYKTLNSTHSHITHNSILAKTPAQPAPQRLLPEQALPILLGQQDRPPLPLYVRASVLATPCRDLRQICRNMDRTRARLSRM